MLRLKRLKLAEQGFTLIEVLVAILVTTLFISIAMQAIVFAAVFKVKAQEYAEATSWIQEDLENVKYQAGKLQFKQTTLTADAATAASSISINAPNADIINSFATNDTLRVGLDPTSYKITSVAGAGTTRTLTIYPNLGSAQLQNAAVVATKTCNPASRNVGLADELRDIVNGASTNDSNYIDSNKYFRTGKTFIMRKTTTTSPDFPHSILQIKYEVSPGNTFDSTKTIAVFNTEVIPDVAFQCP